MAWAPGAPCSHGFFQRFQKRLFWRVMPKKPIGILFVMSSPAIRVFGARASVADRQISFYILRKSEQRAALPALQSLQVRDAGRTEIASGSRTVR